MTHTHLCNFFSSSDLCWMLFLLLTVPDEAEWAYNLHDSHYDWEFSTEASTIPASKVLMYTQFCTRLSYHRASCYSSLTVSSSVGSIKAHSIVLFGGCYFLANGVSMAWVYCVLYNAMRTLRQMLAWSPHYKSFAMPIHAGLRLKGRWLIWMQPIFCVHISSVLFVS